MNQKRRHVQLFAQSSQTCNFCSCKTHIQVGWFHSGKKYPIFLPTFIQWWRSTPPSPELLRHAPSHLIQFFILQHSSRTGTKRCSALQPIFCSTLPTEQVLRVFHEINPLDLRTIRGATSETWEKYNVKKLDRSQKKLKAGETNLWREDYTWSQMLALFWKQLVQHFGSECESEQWMMPLQSKRNSTRFINTGKYDHKFWS